MTKTQINTTLLVLSNPELPLKQRSTHLIDILAGAEKGEANYTALVEEVFQRLANQADNEAAAKRAKMLRMILTQIESAPLRPATFIGLADTTGSGVPHALVIMDSGETAYVVVPNPKEMAPLNLGDRVALDAQGKILASAALEEAGFGEEAKLERKVDGRHIEAVLHQEERVVLMAGPQLMGQIESGAVKPGASLVMGAGHKLAVRALPPPDDKLSYFRFLDRGAIPDVRVDRDIGSPPKVIRQVELHVREEMTRPELRRKYHLRPCITRLLCGVSGTGKTLAVQAIHRRIYEIMSEITRTPMEELPPRVFRLRSSQMLSMWFGESDKNIDRLFDEVEQLAEQPFSVSGKEYRLPVMVVLEEADGLGRARGGDQIYDRIMTVILQRLDPNREGLANKLVVFLSTTNEAGIVDPAFLRRIGGSVEVFGRLDREGFVSILIKHVGGLPSRNKPEKLAEFVARALFDNGDQGVVELTCHNQAEPLLKYRRDFLTGAMIDRAVQQAASTAWEADIGSEPESAISPQLLEDCLEQQVRSVVHQLQPDNVHHYLDLPDGVRVTHVRRIPQNV